MTFLSKLWKNIFINFVIFCPVNTAFTVVFNFYGLIWKFVQKIANISFLPKYHLWHLIENVIRYGKRIWHWKWFWWCSKLKFNCKCYLTCFFLSLFLCNIFCYRATGHTNKPRIMKFGMHIVFRAKFWHRLIKFWFSLF